MTPRACASRYQPSSIYPILPTRLYLQKLSHRDSSNDLRNVRPQFSCHQPLVRFNCSTPADNPVSTNSEACWEQWATTIAGSIVLLRRSRREGSPCWKYREDGFNCPVDWRAGCLTCECIRAAIRTPIIRAYVGRDRAARYGAFTPLLRAYRSSGIDVAEC